MDDREELASLRRLAELEAKAGGAAPTPREAPGSQPLPSFGQRMGDMGMAAAQGMVRGGLPGMISGATGEGMKQFGQGVDRAAYEGGGAVTDALAPYVPPEVAGGAGYLTNVATQAIPAFVGGALGSATKPATQGAGKWFMQSAVKPVVKDLQSGAAKKAVGTMLDEGINATTGGMDKLQRITRALDDQVRSEVTMSPAKISKQKVIDALRSTVDDAARQADPTDDLKAIEKVRQSFKDHPLLNDLDFAERQLAKRIEDKFSSKVSALRDSGRFATTASQQENLAHGGVIGKYAGGSGRPSPVAVPVEGMPRVPGRITTNIERVPEASAAAKETFDIAQQRQKELDFLKYQIDALRREGSGIPVQLAQELKQGTYRALGNKSYGEIGAASTEAQKALARGLREQIAENVPSVVAPLRRESDLMNVLSVAERRALQEASKNPMGLSMLTQNPYAWAGFMADKSALFKSLLARSLHTGGGAAATTAGATTGALIGAESGRSD